MSSASITAINDLRKHLKTLMEANKKLESQLKDNKRELTTLRKSSIDDMKLISNVCTVKSLTTLLSNSTVDGDDDITKVNKLNVYIEDLQAVTNSIESLRVALTNIKELTLDNVNIHAELDALVDSQPLTSAKDTAHVETEQSM